MECRICRHPCLDLRHLKIMKFNSFLYRFSKFELQTEKDLMYQFNKLI